MVGAAVFIFFGVFALVAPSSFYEAVAEFEPYNAHFLQDIGAFQIGIGVALLLAVSVTSDALAASTLGAGVGSLAHVVSHLLALDAGGNPVVDVPIFTILAAVLIGAGLMRLRAVSGDS